MLLRLLTVWQLLHYTNELKNEEVKKSLRTEAKKNAARLDEFKENAPKETATTTSVAPQTTAAPKAAPKKKAAPVVEEKKEEEVEQTTATPQEDPEDDTFDSTPFYDKDDE